MLSSDNPADDPLIDISHESLIRQWQTLRDWVDQEAAAAKLYGRLAETAADYYFEDQHGEAEASLYHGAYLERAIAWQKRYQPNPDWAKRYPGDFGQAMTFLRESRLARCNEKREGKRARAERERLLKEKAEQERASRKKARCWTAAMAVLALLMLVLAGTSGLFWFESVRQAGIAKEQTERAQDQFLAANFNLTRAYEETARSEIKDIDVTGIGGSDDYHRALLLALQAQQLPLPAGKEPLRFAARDALSQPAPRAAFAQRWSSPTLNLVGVGSLAYSPDSKVLASGSVDRTVRLWDLRPLHLLLNPGIPSPRAAPISGALQRLWSLRINGLDIEPESWDCLLPQDGYYVDQEITLGEEYGPEYAGRTFNIRPLLAPDALGVRPFLPELVGPVAALGLECEPHPLQQGLGVVHLQQVDDPPRSEGLESCPAIR